jgi:hypothetical protein
MDARRHRSQLSNPSQPSSGYPEILQPRDWQVSDVNETAGETWSKLEYLYGKTSSAGYEMHEYLEELLMVDFSKFAEDMKLSSVAPFTIHFRRLVSALGRTEMQLLKKAYNTLFMEAFRGSYDPWAERWLMLARLHNSAIMLDVLYAFGPEVLGCPEL